jgi:N6-L-threonylcarbamoyladenine synthase
MRYVLAFDAATEHVAVGVAVLPGQGVTPILLAERDFSAPRAALGALLPAVREVVANAGLKMDEISVVAVGRGPGSFTSVRIAVASAKGLAHGLGVPLVGLSTLDAIAWRFREHTGLVGVIGDAMRGEVYPALFRCSEGRCVRLEPDRVEKPAAAAAHWAESLEEPVVLAGNGLAKYRELFMDVLGERAAVSDQSLWTATGASVTAAAWSEEGPGTLRSVTTLDPVSGYEQADPGTLLPVYTRLSDAEEAERPHAAPMPPSGVTGPDGGVS